MKVDRFDIDVKIEGVLIEENRASCVMGHVEAIRENVVVNVVGRLLQGNDRPPSCDLFFEGILLPPSGSKVPVVDGGATLAVHLIGQVGFVIGNPSGSRLQILGRKPLWKNGSSSVVSILMNRPLLTILSSRAPIAATVSLGQPGFLNNVILYPVTTIPREQPHFWER